MKRNKLYSPVSSLYNPSFTRKYVEGSFFQRKSSTRSSIELLFMSFVKSPNLIKTESVLTSNLL